MKYPFLRALCLLCAVVLLSTVALTGCGNETPAADTDPHAGHNHATETDPHAGHNHATDATDAPIGDKHEHKESAAMRMAYEEEKGGTFTLIIKDCEGNQIYKKTGLAKKAASRQVTPEVAELYWVTSSKPGGYECLYINRLTCQVSDTIVGEQFTDGQRIVYTEIKDGVLNVTVRDLFDKNGYSKTTEIKDAYTAGEYTVLGTVKVKDQVNVSFLTDKDGSHRIMSFDLYENKADGKPQATKKTAAKK